MTRPRSLFDKLWDTHEVHRREDGAKLLRVDRHFVHEGSIHAFDRIAARGRAVSVRRATRGAGPGRGRSPATARDRAGAR